MGYQIRNSNQFASWAPGTYLTPSDYLVETTGSDLPTTQDASLTDETEITVEFILRRNTFDTTRKPKGYLDAAKVLNLSYKEQVAYVNSLSAKEIHDWYGASEDDLKAVTSYLLGSNATILEADQEKRSVKAKLTLGNFKSAFLSENPDVIFSDGEEEGELYYYNPNNYADSYLAADGRDGELFANAVIGNSVSVTNAESDIGDEENTVRAAATGSQLNVVDPKAPKSQFSYYPLEIASQYKYPNQTQTGAGKNVGVGIIGTGGEELEKYLNINNTLKNYLKAQGIKTKQIGRLISPNTPSDPKATDDSWWSEVTLDFSILRSLAPKSDIYISKVGEGSMTKLYGAYADLIYNPNVDVIANSGSYTFQPGNFNQTEALNQLFTDALLRGKTVVSASGDVGTASNTHDLVPNGFAIPYPDSSPALLSVGGTAYSPKAQDLIWPRANVLEPTAFPPSFTSEVLDELTGLINDQATWNSNIFIPSSDYLAKLKDKDPKDPLVYPTISGEFAAEDFKGDNVTFFNAFDNTIESSGVQNSSILPMPAYQQKNLEEKWLGTGRRYPDVSALANENKKNGAVSWYYQLMITTNGDQTDYIPAVRQAGGTSAAGPLVAGLMANLTSYIRKRFGKKQKLGMINPLLYEAYNSKDRDKVFFDVPEGSNNANVFKIATSPDDWSGYTIPYKVEDGGTYLIPVNGTGPGGQLDTNLSNTGKGFDAATGLGSINGEGLLDQVVSVFSQL